MALALVGHSGAHTGSAFADSNVKDGAARLQLLLDDGQEPLIASLIWPARSPQQLQTEALLSPNPRVDYTDIDDGIQILPPYARSLLRVRVPVSVSLASTRRTLRRILELIRDLKEKKPGKQ